jgi:hypothetical protein
MAAFDVDQALVWTQTEEQVDAARGELCAVYRDARRRPRAPEVVDEECEGAAWAVHGELHAAKVPDGPAGERRLGNPSGRGGY